MPLTRHHEVRFHRDHRGTGLDWRLYAYGRGHWCVGSGHCGSFPTEAEARRRGLIWDETGLPPCEQTPERIAAVRGRIAA